MDAKMRQSWMDSALSLGELATKGPSLFMAPWVASNATARVAVLVPIEPKRTAAQTRNGRGA